MFSLRIASGRGSRRFPTFAGAAHLGDFLPREILTAATSENAARAFRAAKKRFRPRQRLRSQRKVGRFQRRVARASARSAGIPAGTWSMTLGP